MIIVKYECHVNLMQCYCRAASVSERSEANDRVLFEILLCVYTYIYVRTLRKQVLQLRKLDTATVAQA